MMAESQQEPFASIPAAQWEPDSLHYHPIARASDSSDPTAIQASPSQEYTVPPSAEATRTLLSDEEQKVEAMSPVPRGSPSAAPAKDSWLARNFERPDWPIIILHVALCIVSFPFIYFLLPHARGTLFWVRVYVGLACSVVGIVVGYSMLRLARKWIEAAAWATVIHQSVSERNDGIRLRDMAVYTSDSGSALIASKILWDRWTYFGTSRRSRKNYDQRPWSLFVLFFLLCLAVAASLSFVLGRVVNIKTRVILDTKHYREAAIAGDLSEADLANAATRQEGISGDGLSTISIWSLARFNPLEDQSRVTVQEYKNHSIYFTESISSQMWEGGKGKGTFDFVNDTNAAFANVHRRDVDDGSDMVQNADDSSQSMQNLILTYPKWGLRIHCENIPDAPKNIIPRSKKNNTYLFVPRDSLSKLYANFSLPLPERFIDYTPDHLLGFLNSNDSLPDDFQGDPSSWGLGFQAYSSLGSVSLFSVLTNDGNSGGGWEFLEVYFVRLNTAYAPQGKFPLKYTFSDTYNQDTVGFDAVVCLELIEPWIVRVYNSTTASPRTLRVLGPGGIINDLDGEEERRGEMLRSEVSRNLTSARKYRAFDVAHRGAIDQISQGGSSGSNYAPTTSLDFFSDGSGPLGYVALRGESHGVARAIADSSFILPFLSGTGLVAARVYDNITEAFVHVALGPLLAALGTALVLGAIAGLAAPKLPKGVPRREFGLYSWIAAIHGDALTQRELKNVELRPGMDVQAIETKVGDVKVRYEVAS